MARIDGVIFDLDGTLIDTLDDLTDSVNFVLTQNGFSQKSKEQIKSYVGNGILKLIERALYPIVDRQVIDKLYKEMLSFYKEHSLIKTQPYDKIETLLNFLKENGIKIGVVTNKSQDAAEIIINRFFSGYFNSIIGDNKQTPLKPSPQNIDRAIFEMGISKQHILYIGDSEVDVLTAKNADVFCVSVLWGFRTKEQLINSGAKDFADSPSDIISFIKSSC